MESILLSKGLLQFVSKYEDHFGEAKDDEDETIQKKRLNAYMILVLSIKDSQLHLRENIERGRPD